jgi:hypothetical protein
MSDVDPAKQRDEAQSLAGQGGARVMIVAILEVVE